MEYQDYTTHHTDWISFLIISVVFLYGLLHFSGVYQIREAFGLLFTKEGYQSKDSASFTSLLLSFNSLIVLVLFFFTGLRFFELNQELDYILFLRIGFGVLVAIALQRLVIYLQAGLTDTLKFFTNYFSIQNQFVHLAAFLSLPLLILGNYSSYISAPFLIAGAIVFGGMYLFGIMKSIASSNKIKGPLKFHLIFYLCGIEILPIFLIYKILI